MHFERKTKMNIPKLDARLSAAVEAVKDGGVVADVGTDHAYLPVYLVMSGKSDYAIASDINEGPVRRAMLSASASSPPPEPPARTISPMPTPTNTAPSTAAVSG